MHNPLPEELETLGKERRENWKETLIAQGVEVPPDLLLSDSFLVVLACSDYFWLNALKYPEAIISFWEEGVLEKNQSCDMYRTRLAQRIESVLDEKEWGVRLRQFRAAEMLRLIWRTFLQQELLPQITQELSFLADTLIEASLIWVSNAVSKQYALNEPQPLLLVVALGKLGAFELNLSSDIDLMYISPKDPLEQVPGTHLCFQEFYEKIARRLSSLLHENTEEGFVFRVDLRLRPYGNSGPLVMGIDALENYYSEQGRDWERYALIKARVITPNAQNVLTHIIRPFVYRRYIDFGAFEALRSMHDMIQNEVRKNESFDDIKKGPGGIREIEFIVQAFQLIRGGPEPALREANLLKVIPILVERKLLCLESAQKLIQAYYFLRNTEHILQAFADQQTHQLPSNTRDQCRLATLMGYASWEMYQQALNTHRMNVQNEFTHLSALPPKAEETNQKENKMREIWRGLLSQEAAQEEWARLGGVDSETVLIVSRDFFTQIQCINLTPIAKTRIDTLMPLVLNALLSIKNPKETLLRIVKIFYAILKRSAYLALLIENPQALNWVITLCEKSDWISDVLSRHPILLDELLNLHIIREELSKNELIQELQLMMQNQAAQDLELQMDTLRYFKMVNVLRVATASVMGWLPLRKVSQNLTELALVILEYVVQLALSQMEQATLTIQDIPFGIIAYGKLAGHELGFSSDLDLVFIYDDTQKPDETLKSYEMLDFYLRLSRRILHLLTTRTHLGILYEVDTQLRPLGHAGLLVSTLSYFQEYQKNQAWTWEHQALVRARLVIGSLVLENKFEHIRKEILQMHRDNEKLKIDLCTMRQKILNQTKTPPNHWDIKKGKGGIIDIEFLVQYWVLCFAQLQPELLRYTDNEGILDCLEANALISNEQAQVLKEAYTTYRDALHDCNLAQQPGIVAATAFQVLREKAINIWNTCFGITH